MMYVLLYALCIGSDVTVGIIKRGAVTCSTGIIIIMIMLVVYCLFLVVLYVCIFVCGSAIQ